MAITLAATRPDAGVQWNGADAPLLSRARLVSARARVRGARSAAFRGFLAEADSFLIESL